MPRKVDNPPNPWSSTIVDWLGDPPEAKLEVYEETARSIVAKNDSPDVPFRFSVNPYRGCYHGCAYCYARPSHEYLGFGAGSDFERKIVVKTNAAVLLAKELARPSWSGEALAFSGVTDCYQPLEAAYGVTRACLEACLRAKNPVGIVTKGALIRRDLDVLAALHRVADARVYLSIPFATDELGRAIEPWASRVSARFEAIEALASAGIPVGVAVAPLIPGLNDDQVPSILERARKAGARHAFKVLLRLPGPVAEVFAGRLREAVPERASRVLAEHASSRQGRPDESRFGHRMHGEGPRWRAIADLFELHARRLGFVGVDEAPKGEAFFAPRRGQLPLF